MSRRAQRPELEFGSDSFLDVVCNIVGILIILIVVVGVKVERQPKLTEQATAQASQRGVNQAQLLAERQRAFDLLRRDEQETVGQLQTLQTDDAQSQLLIQQTMEAQELARQQLESDQQQAERRRKQAADLEADRDAMAARVASLQKILKDKSQDNLKLGQRLARVSTSEKEFDEKLQATVIETQKLQEVLESAEQAARPTAKMQHRLSPVTKPAENAEVHFRVSNGRISEIPLEELLDRLKEQVLARRSTVMRFNQFDGVVGPVHGYVMNYTVEKEGPTTLEALQTGDGRTRHPSALCSTPPPAAARWRVARGVHPRHQISCHRAAGPRWVGGLVRRRPSTRCLRSTRCTRRRSFASAAGTPGRRTSRRSCSSPPA